MTYDVPAVTCIGLANVDVIANVSEDFLRQHNIVKAATTSLDASSTGMILGKLSNPVFYPGGCAANTACGLSALGVETSFVGKTGDDTYAEIFYQGFQPTAVEFKRPLFSAKMTSTCLTLVTPDKDRSFALCTDTAGWYLSASDLPEITKSKSQFVYLESNTACMTGTEKSNLLLDAVKKYGNTGIQIIINLNDREIVRQSRKTLLALLEKDIAFFIGNIAEIHTLFETANLEDAITAAQQSGCHFAITDGPNGAVIVRANDICHVPAIRLHNSQIINTIGAGDQFAGGFIAGLTAGLSDEQAAQAGIQAATSIIQTISARPEKKKLRNIMG